MRWFKIWLILCIVRYYHSVQSYDSTFLIETYANLTGAVAEYYSSGCIYLLTHSEEQDKIELFMTAKYISRTYGIFNNILTFSDYFDMLSTVSDLDLCYAPLQVIIDNKENHKQLRDAFSIHSNRTSMHGMDQYNGGIWLIFLKSLDQTYIDDYFQIINTPFDAQIIVASVNKNQVLMKEVYRVAPNFPLRQPHYGHWSIEKRLNGPKDISLYERRSDLEGLELKVGWDEMPPMTVIKNNMGVFQLRGFLGDVWSIIQSAINVSCQYEEYDELGSCSNGVCTGLAKALLDHKVDIGVSPYILTRDRYDIMDFSFPISVTRFQIFYQHPGSIADIDWFLCPFGIDVWFTLMTWVIFSAAFLYCGCYIRHHWLESDENFTLVESFFIIFDVLCGQGAAEVPKSTPNRIIFFFTLSIATIIIPAYSASLVSYLTVQYPVIPFTNLQELYNGKRYRLILRSGSYEYDMFEGGSKGDSYVGKIFERDLKSRELPPNNTEGISMLCEDRYAAFFGVESSIDWNLDNTEEDRKKKGCIITKMQDNAGKISIGYGFPKKSHIRGIVNHHLKNLESIGVIDRIKKAYWAKIDNRNPKDNWSPVSLESTVLIFAIVVLGIFFATIIFFLELYLRPRSLPLPSLENPWHFIRPMEVKIQHSYIGKLLNKNSK